MDRKNKILVPDDGSTFSRHVFPHIRRYFPPDQNELILLRVSDDPGGHVGKPTGPSTMDADLLTYPSRKERREAMHPIFASQERASAVADLSLDLRDDQQMLETLGYTVHSEVILDRGRGEAIVRYAENHDVDIVAMTTHWRTGLNKLIFGSVAQYVARHVNIPIFMIRPEVE